MAQYWIVVHAAKLLRASGHASKLRTMISAEQSRGLDFLRPPCQCTFYTEPNGKLRKTSPRSDVISCATVK